MSRRPPLLRVPLFVGYASEFLNLRKLGADFENVVMGITLVYQTTELIGNSSSGLPYFLIRLRSTSSSPS